MSKATDVPVRTIKRIEAEDGVPSAGAKTLQSLQIALEAAGIEFIGSPDDRPGIRLRQQGEDVSETSGDG